MCGVWLAMEDVLPGSGALRYIEGSHRWPIMSNMLLGRRGWRSELNSAQDPYQDAFEQLITTHQATAQVFHARKGQALIWTANLLHGGSPRTNPALTRWSQVTHYYFDDCVYYTPALSDEPLGRLALRNITDASTGLPVPNQYLGEEVAMPMPEQRPSRVPQPIRKLINAVRRK
jgi:ectoine hydroxylase-related dioxygenase (phytanoyl-CoA dioxygenase family)